MYMYIYILYEVLSIVSFPKIYFFTNKIISQEMCSVDRKLFIIILRTHVY